MSFTTSTHSSSLWGGFWYRALKSCATLNARRRRSSSLVSASPICQPPCPAALFCAILYVSNFTEERNLTREKNHHTTAIHYALYIYSPGLGGRPYPQRRPARPAGRCRRPGRILAQPGGAAEATRLLIGLGYTAIQQGTTTIVRPTPKRGSLENPYTEADFLGVSSADFERLFGDIIGTFYKDHDGIIREIKDCIGYPNDPIVSVSISESGKIDFCP